MLSADQGYLVPPPRQHLEEQLFSEAAENVE